MFRQRLPWLLAVPLMAMGSIAAHVIGYAGAPGTGEHGHDEARELAALHERSSEGSAGHVVLPLGLVAALLLVVGIRLVVSRLRGGDSRGLGAGSFFLLPLLAYSSQELIERLVNAEGFPFDAVLEPRFLLGLVLQLPFAAVAFLLGRSLLRVGKRLIRLFARRPVPRHRARPTRPRCPTGVTLLRVRPLSRGHPLRGPPLLA
jgi:hypothetical protein